MRVPITCAISFWGAYQGEAYILDVIYTKEPMEVTEQDVARALHEFKGQQG